MIKKLLILAATAALTAACCCNNGKNAENCQNTCPETKTECCENKTTCLEGKWTIASVNGEEIKLETMPFIEFNLAEKKFHGNAGVNIMNGDFTLTEKSLSFGNAATTMMAGLEAESNIERAILDNLSKVSSFSCKCSNSIELTDAEGKVIFVLSK